MPPMALCAQEVLGSAEAPCDWLKRPNVVLGADRPLDLLGTDEGAVLVEEELSRIAYADFA